MKIVSAVFVATLLLGLPVRAEQIVTLGDSLTFAYETEFGSKVSIPFGPSYGDGFGPSVKNWIEILNDPAYRHIAFDLGPRDTLTINLPVVPDLDVFFRNRNNWALPGLKIAELWKFLDHEITISSILDPDLAKLLALTNFNEFADFGIANLENQVQTTAQRLTLFIGGNDLRGVYGDIYNRNDPGTFVADFLGNATAIIDRIQQLNPNIEIVLVNVPHIGITPEVKSKWPPDPVRTGQVTAVVLDLNRQLADLAHSHHIGYADICTPTLPLLGRVPLCIDGITFANSGSTSGNLSYVWLNGELSSNFHPNTNAQAVIANVIIDAFNRRYHCGIAPLTATEILSGLIGKTQAQIDMDFATWTNSYQLPGRPLSDDSDGDGIPAGMEFALGLEPNKKDADRIGSRVAAEGLELTYPIRVPNSSHFTLAPEWSTDLSSPFTPFAVAPIVGEDGLSRAILPISDSHGFLRLRVSIP